MGCSLKNKEINHNKSHQEHNETIKILKVPDNLPMSTLYNLNGDFLTLIINMPYFLAFCHLWIIWLLDSTSSEKMINPVSDSCLGSPESMWKFGRI